MGEEPKGCARVTSTVEGASPAADEPIAETASRREERIMGVRVGQKAPQFRAPAFHEGKFTEVALEDHAGKWVLLCFYPGDFTFT